MRLFHSKLCGIYINFVIPKNHAVQCYRCQHTLTHTKVGVWGVAVKGALSFNLDYGSRGRYIPHAMFNGRMLIFNYCSWQQQQQQICFLICQYLRHMHEQSKNNQLKLLTKLFVIYIERTEGKVLEIFSSFLTLFIYCNVYLFYLFQSNITLDNVYSIFRSILLRSQLNATF